MIQIYLSRYVNPNWEDELMICYIQQHFRKDFKKQKSAIVKNKMIYVLDDEYPVNIGKYNETFLWVYILFNTIFHYAIATLRLQE